MPKPDAAAGWVMRDGAGWQERPPAPPGAHYHECAVLGCQTYLVCFSDHEHCPTADKWVCPGCELRAVDAYLTEQERAAAKRRITDA